MQRMRSTPGVQVVQLNHPRNVHSNFSPTSAEHFNYSTGRNLRGPQWSFDAFEVITSAALQDDLHRLFRDWFGVLNHGHRITGLGSSDTHDVSRYILVKAVPTWLVTIPIQSYPSGSVVPNPVQAKPLVVYLQM